MSSGTLLEVNNIETFNGPICAIRDVSLSIDVGDITSILGNNGAGKSTILKTIVGLLKGQPVRGTIEFMGRRIDGKATEEIVRRGISYVPEGGAVFEKLSVKENLLMGAYLRKDRMEVKNDFDLIYRHFPLLKARENHKAGSLAGVEQKMLGIGRALMNRPILILLDEPSTGLSPILVNEIFQIIKTINEEGVSILLVEQNAGMALAISDFGIILENGRIAVNGKAKDIIAHKDVKEFWMGI